MCSLDVSSLFTNVPFEETLNICLDKLYSLTDPPALPRVVLRKLLEFATKKSHFLFDGKYKTNVVEGLLEWYYDQNSILRFLCISKNDLTEPLSDRSFKPSF